MFSVPREVQGKWQSNKRVMKMQEVNFAADFDIEYYYMKQRQLM
jgi:hypothetical protein